MSSQSATIRNAVDTFANTNAASRNYVDAKSLGLDSGEMLAFLHFNRPFPLGSTIVSATLRVYTKGSWGITPTLTAKRTDAAWKASKLTWNDKPGVVGGGANVSHSSAADGNEFAFDVTSIMQVVSDGGAYYGFRIETDSTVTKYIYSADSVNFRPTLDVTWSEQPQAPSTLAPSGGRVVSVAKPLLRFDFTDEVGSTALAAVQVQMNATNVWTAPSFDTASFSVTEPEMDLAAFETQNGAAVGTVASTNQVRNPSFETDATLWSGVNSTIARSTVWAATGVASGRVTVTTGGVAAYVYPVGTSGGVYYASVPGEYVSLRYRVKAIRACALRCDVISHNAASTVLGSVSSSVVSLAAGEDATVELVNAPITIATTTKYLPVLRIYENSGLTAPSSSATVYVDVDQARTLNHGTTPAPITTLDYRDGTFPAWVWSGTANLSTSSTNVYPGIAAGVSTYWRVRVQDGAGLWSAWSDAAQFRRDAKGTLTISNPAVSPNNYVTEWTPPIIWGLTGETQTSYQVIVTETDDRTVIAYDSGRLKGAATSLTLPKAKIVDGRTYGLVVRIWDSKDREHTPGDRAYTEATRDFLFAEDATVTTVSALTVTQIAQTPWVNVNFTRATAPDSFNLLRSDDAGVTYPVADSGILPADVLVSGTTYKIIDRDARPARSHIWKVQAVVGGKSSASNPTFTFTASPVGVWIYDTERDIDLFVSATSAQTSFDTVHEGATYTPIGAAKPVRFTQSVGGLKGVIVGVLREGGAKSAAYWITQAESIRNRPGRTLTLSYGDESYPVVFGKIDITQFAENATDKNISMEFWQVGKLPEVRL